MPSAAVEAATKLADQLVQAAAVQGVGVSTDTLCIPEFLGPNWLKCRVIARDAKPPFARGDVVEVPGGAIVRFDTQVDGDPISVWLRAEPIGSRWLFVDGDGAAEGPTRLGGAPAPALPAASPFAQALLTALPQGPEGVRPLCSAAALANRASGCEALAGAVFHVRPALRVHAERVTGERRVIELDLIRDLKTPERAWLSVVREGGGERLDCVGHSREEAHAFLAGTGPSCPATAAR